MVKSIAIVVGIDLMYHSIRITVLLRISYDSCDVDGGYVRDNHVNAFSVVPGN